MRFHLSGRYVSWYADRNPGIPRPAIESHVANMHLVPADEEVEALPVMTSSWRAASVPSVAVMATVRGRRPLK